jgi:hypothetical protein
VIDQESEDENDDEDPLVTAARTAESQFLHMNFEGMEVDSVMVSRIPIRISRLTVVDSSFSRSQDLLKDVISKKALARQSDNTAVFAKLDEFTNVVENSLA